MVTEEKLEQKRAQKQKQAKDAEELLSDLDSHDDGSDYSSDKDGGIDDEEEEDNHKESHVAEEEDVKPRAKSKKNKGKEANVLVMKTWNLKRMRLSSLVPVATKPTKVPRIESSSYSTQTSTSNPTKTKPRMPWNWLSGSCENITCLRPFCCWNTKKRTKKSRPARTKFSKGESSKF